MDTEVVERSAALEQFILTYIDAPVGRRNSLCYAMYDAGWSTKEVIEATTRADAMIAFQTLVAEQAEVRNKLRKDLGLSHKDASDSVGRAATYGRPGTRAMGLNDPPSDADPITRFAAELVDAGISMGHGGPDQRMTKEGLTRYRAITGR